MSNTEEMYVKKRDGSYQEVSFDKILNRVKNLGTEAGISIKYAQLVMKVIDQLYDKIDTSKIDELTAEQCASMSTIHLDYGILAARIVISNLHKNTDPSFYLSMKKLHDFHDIHNKHVPIIDTKIMNIIAENKDFLDSIINNKRDNEIDYFGFKTLERAYLLRVNGEIVERPQYMWLRVALGIHGDDMVSVKETYDLMSQKYFTHATPTLFNAATPRPQLSSCYLIALEEDSIDGIYNTLKDCAKISKWAGGIGLHIHNIRACGSHIRGTNGTSNGIVPMLSVFNKTARYVDQCVTPETYIYTTAGPKQMQELTTNDYIFNETGGVEQIENILEHPYSGQTYSIKTMHCLDPLVITDEHPVYVLSNQKRGINYSIIEKRLQKDHLYRDDDPNKLLVWKNVKDLGLDDMLAYPIPKYEKDVKNITADDCYMYGIILGNGDMLNTGTTGHISLHKIKNRGVADFCRIYFEKKCIDYRVDDGHVDSHGDGHGDETVQIRWSKTLEMPIKYSDVYDINKEKNISSRWLNLPLEKAKYIIKGLIDTDQCNSKELLFDNTSRNLIESMRYILLRMEIPTNGHIRNNANKESIENKKILYTLRIPKTEEICNLIGNNNKAFSKFFKYNNFVFTRIKSIVINPEEYNGTLYDLQMTKTHNYMIHNGLIHNGGGKRNGSFAIYIEPHHADIESFLDLKKNHGDEELRARDLFYAVWISDLFMERVKEQGVWSLFCPDICPGLSDKYGDDFKELYLQYEREKKYVRQVNARDIWVKILESQMETGTPYMLYKDAVNTKSNQKNLGTILSSNLCCEITEYSDSKETAVCNLASVAVNKCVKSDKTFDYKILHRVTKAVTKNLNKIIDVNFYPTEKTRLSNYLHRPIGIGIQGLADAFILMGLPFESDEAKDINKKIFETMYHASLEQSFEISYERNWSIKYLKEEYEYGNWTFKSEDPICREYNVFNITSGSSSKTLEENSKVEMLLNKYKPLYNEICRENNNNNNNNTLGSYSSFIGSPASNGILQFDMWGVTPSDRYDWDKIKELIKQYGIRNSLLLAPMPTASTSQILGNNECFEPFTSNIYTRRTLAGEFVLVNKHLMSELIELGVWSESVKNNIIANKGSVQYIEGLPQNIKDKYKIVWEMSMKNLIDMSRDRGAFICQSQSLNLWVEDPDIKSLTNMHFYSWKSGLKTGIYYLRRKPKHQPQQFTIEPDKKPSGGIGGSGGEDEPCEMCSG